MSKRVNKPKMRRELDAMLAMIADKWRIALDFDDTDAVSLEHLAHALQGVEFDLEKAGDLAGALAIAINTNVEELV